MPFNIRMGLPEMAALWQDLSTRKLQGKLDANKAKLFAKLVKSLGFLAANPRHPRPPFTRNQGDDATIRL
jgi:hypothetical protein